MEYILAGATAVQIGTANYRNPGTGENIVNQLNNGIQESKWESTKDMIGKVETHS